MKFALLAAAAVIATPVLAQETPATAPMGQTAPAPDQSTAMPQGDMSAQTPPPPPAPDASTQTTGGMANDPSMQSPPPAPADPNAPTPAGGYQPSGSATSGPVQPGAQVVFKPAPSPSEAFPPPPPKASYPICKKGQYDGCMQRGGK